MIINLSTWQGYDLAAALRGPDLNGCDVLKEVFTERIRFKGGAAESGGMVRKNPLPENDHSVIRDFVKWSEDADNRDFVAMTHYLSHVKDGISALITLEGGHDPALEALFDLAAAMIDLICIAWPRTGDSVERASRIAGIVSAMHVRWEVLARAESKEDGLSITPY